MYMSIYSGLTLCEQFQSIGTMTTAQECIFARVLMDAYQHGLVPDKKERLTQNQNSKVRSIVDGAAINLLNIPETFKCCSKPTRTVSHWTTPNTV
jgi:hypothetical protein